MTCIQDKRVGDALLCHRMILVEKAVRWQSGVDRASFLMVQVQSLSPTSSIINTACLPQSQVALRS